MPELQVLMRPTSQQFLADGAIYDPKCRAGWPPRLPAPQLHHSVLLPTKPYEQAVDTDG